MSYRVSCDTCDTGFAVNLQRYHTEAGVLLVEMVCPHCSARYEVATIDAEGLRLSARIERMRDSGMAGTPQFEKLLSSYREHVTVPEERSSDC